MILYYYYPGKMFPAISVTGAHCEVMCLHCRGRYLKSMIHAETPEKLIDVCTNLDEKGVIGCLISGGCDLSGRVPLPLEALHYIREETDLVLNLHTGLVNAHTVRKLREIDPYISFEVPTPSVISQLYQLEVTQQDYVDSLTLLKGLKVTPHIMIGFNPQEERETIKKVEKMGFSSLVVIVFTPTRGTPFCDHPDTEEVIKTCDVARTLFPRLILGCMRPRIKELEEKALLFDGIVLPTLWAKEQVQEAGIPVEIKNTCCVVE
ncbi:MAG: hypothetical protein AYK19_02580 [Theionarchaea archaeon DG-70-1]|nr:MAG: hypothetical protein AYK19_02580 [Theionarchaea archaeon DG-70-1]